MTAGPDAAEIPVTCTPYRWPVGTTALYVHAAYGPGVDVDNGRFSVGDAEGNSFYDVGDVDALIACLVKARELLLADRERLDAAAGLEGQP